MPGLHHYCHDDNLKLFYHDYQNIWSSTSPSWSSTPSSSSPSSSPSSHQSSSSSSRSRWNSCQSLIVHTLNDSTRAALLFFLLSRQSHSGKYDGDDDNDYHGDHDADHEGDYHDADVCGCVNHHHRLLQQQPLPRLFPPWRSVLCTSPCGASPHHQ